MRAKKVSVIIILLCLLSSNSSLFSISACQMIESNSADTSSVSSSENRPIVHKRDSYARDIKQSLSIQNKELVKDIRESYEYLENSASQTSEGIRLAKISTIATKKSVNINNEKDTRALNDTPGLLKIYYENLNGEIVTYGHANETLYIYFEIKGHINIGDTLEVTIRRDIVSFPDSDLSVGYYTFDYEVLGDEYVELYWEVKLDEDISDFGLGIGDIRSYFLKVHLDSFGYLFDGSDTDHYRLWMVGSLSLYGVEYYNVTSEGILIATSFAKPGWQICTVFYIVVENAPIWGFDIQSSIKANIVFWSDIILFSDDKKTVNWILDPGIYYFEFSDINWDPIYITIPTDRSYGNGIGDTRNLFGTAFQNNNELDPTNEDLERNELYILPNTKAQSPSVQIENPLDGEITYNDTISLSAKIRDPNSNFEISEVSIYIEGEKLDVTEFYDPYDGRLDIIIKNSFAYSGVKEILLVATDFSGKTTTDTVYIQYYTRGYWFPNSYQVISEQSSLNILNNQLYYNFTYSWTDDTREVNVTPYLQIDVETELDYELIKAYPNSVNPGDEFTAYIKFVNPKLYFNVKIKLGIDYTFEGKRNFFKGSSTLFEKEITKSIPVNFGIFRIDLRQVSETIANLAHFELETKDYIPFLPSWLANFKFEFDFIPILKIKNLLSFDVNTLNCESKFETITVGTEETIPIHCIASKNTNGEDEIEINLENFEISAGVGAELYANITFSGKLLFNEIGPINVNEWLYDHFGILVPYLDFWLPDLLIPLYGYEQLLISINPVPLGINIEKVHYKDNNVTIDFSVVDPNDNLIEDVDIDIQYGSQLYEATEVSSGKYQVTIQYVSDFDTISIAVQKPGYIGKELTVQIQVELDVSLPTETEKGGYSLVSLSILTISVLSLIAVFMKKKK